MVHALYVRSNREVNQKNLQKTKVVVPIVMTALPTGLCLLALPLWLLGVPGVENEYARAWGDGLRYLLFYIGYGISGLVLYLSIRISVPLGRRTDLVYLSQFLIISVVFAFAMKSVFDRM